MAEEIPGVWHNCLMAIEPGPQFITLYRGIRHVGASDVLGSEKPLGVHWTPDPEIARSFTVPRKDEEGDPEVRRGTVLQGTVHKDDLMTEDDIREWNAKRHGTQAILPSDTESEKEIPVKPGAKVNIVGAKDITYNPSNTAWNGWSNNYDYEEYDELPSTDVEPGERQA